MTTDNYRPIPALADTPYPTDNIIPCPACAATRLFTDLVAANALWTLGEDYHYDSPGFAVQRTQWQKDPDGPLPAELQSHVLYHQSVVMMQQAGAAAVNALNRMPVPDNHPDGLPCPLKDKMAGWRERAMLTLEMLHRLAAKAYGVRNAAEEPPPGA